MRLIFILILTFVFQSAFSQVATDELPKAPFKTTKIGNQIWSAENLNTGQFRNGDPIPNIQGDDAWEQAGEMGKPAWSCMDNDTENCEKYGKLYNWHAISDPRGLAPEGWRVPKQSDWNKLLEYAGGPAVAAKQLKAKTGWGSSSKFGDHNGTNSSGFSALPGGDRYGYGRFGTQGVYGSWWALDQPLTFYFMSQRGMDEVEVHTDVAGKGRGMSVRLIQE